MDSTVIYALSIGGCLGMGMWWIFIGKRVIGSNLVFSLIYTFIYITLGVLSIKYIDILPVGYNWFKYLTVAVVLIGSVAILLHADTTRVLESKVENKKGED